MSVRAVIGTQWGDEGKGKIVDLLAQDADVVIRFSGGNNAGHSIENEFGKFVVHIIPVGIFNPNTICIVGAGTVVHLETLIDELRELRDLNVRTDNLFISKKAHLVMPWHIWQDQAEEARRNPHDKIGTTNRGMGPVFSDKVARKGLRVGDLLDFDSFRTRFYEIYEEKLLILKHVYGVFTLSFPFPTQILDEFEAFRAEVRDFIIDTEPITWDALGKKKNILLEGAQAILLSIDHGTYPFVTSSNCGAAQAAEGSGIPPNKIDEVIGVVKAYTTRVGAGPFPTRANDFYDERLREAGHEYGATTGRPRMCGWIDLPLLRYAAQLNGFTSLAITKLDVLSGFSRLEVGTGYICEEHHPCTDPYCGLGDKLAAYESVSGWRKDLTGLREYDELPPNARAYIALIEGAMACSARYISVGPKREQTIIRK